MVTGPQAVPAPLYSVSELTLPDTSFFEDIALLMKSLATGIGIWEGKIRGHDDSEIIAALQTAGLTATLCLPEIWSLLPNSKFSEPVDPAERAEAICTSIEHLSKFHPVAVMVTPGMVGSQRIVDADASIVDGLKKITRRAAEFGVNVAIEPIRKSSKGFISSLASALGYRQEVGVSNLGIALDIWHLWDEPGLLELIRDNVDSLLGVQVNDWRSPPRMQSDRLLPGDGVAGVVDIVATLLQSGYRGWYDLEVMSAPELPDSLWLLPPHELLRRADKSFQSVWQQAVRLAARTGAIS